MALQDIASAIERVESIMRRKPELGPHDDAPATARWEGGLQVSANHANGLRIETDMPRELGGGGELVTPGWLLRASTASCAVTRIAMAAAEQGIALHTLEVSVASRSDTRGLLGMAGEGEAPITPAPLSVALRVRIAAAQVPADRLRELVAQGCRCAPVQTALASEVPLTVEVEVVDPPAAAG